jgi:DNA-binding ferritin-like protein
MTEQQHFNIFLGLLATLRSNYLWFHGAHHVTRGPSFVGDHKLYSKIYEQYLAHYDTLAEKSIVLLGERIADPIVVTGAAMQVLSSQPAPSTLSPTAIASAGLAIENALLARLTKSRLELQAASRLSLALDNFMAQVADDHETWVYQLSQRSKG